MGIKKFSDEVIASRSIFKEWLKEVLQTERKL